MCSNPSPDWLQQGLQYIVSYVQPATPDLCQRSEDIKLHFIFRALTGVFSQYKDGTND